jgi:hypothetical protein
MVEKTGFGPGRRRGLVKSLVSLTPEQLEALRQEAQERMNERGLGRMDASEVVREAVDDWAADKGDPAIAAAKEGRRLMAAGDVQGAAKAFDEAQRILKERAAEAVARMQADLDELAKKIKRGRR